MHLFVVVAVETENAAVKDIGKLLHLKPGKPYMLSCYRRKLRLFALQ